MSGIFVPTPPDDPMVQRLSSLRDEAETAGHALLTYLIDVALVEAERIAEERAGLPEGRGWPAGGTRRRLKLE